MFVRSGMRRYRAALSRRYLVQGFSYDAASPTFPLVARFGYS